MSIEYTAEKLKRVLEDRERWLLSVGLPMDHIMIPTERKAFTEFLKEEFDKEPEEIALRQRDQEEKNAHPEMKQSKVQQRALSRFSRV